MAKPVAAVMTARRVSRAALLRGTALQAAVGLVVAAPAMAQPAPGARPQGGQVVAGAASIGTTANATNITQSSNRAAINWRSFDVGSSQSVNFQQPSSTAVTLNRVTGGDPSAIAGRINANGQVILTNPSGVTFYQGAQVNAQSVVVSAAGITNQNFMAGKMVFDQAANPNARIDNRGTITVKQAGLAALVAPSVANSGVINARMGQVVLAGASAHTLDMYGDGLVAIDVTKQVTQAPVGPDGKVVTALVTNTGTIRADGGVVQLTAKAADGVVQTLVRAGGTIRADSVGDRTGRIEIAGTGGSVLVEGRVAADGRAPGTAGGQVVVAGSDTTKIAAGAHVSANGKAGGGTVAVGTTLARAVGRGVAPAGTSARVVVAAGGRVSADAKAAGNGGRVTVLSTQHTAVDGAISARGGKAGGDGGTIELSGETGFTLTGTATTAAPHGALGTIVLDPRDLTITDTPNGTANADPGATTYTTPSSGTDAYVTPSQFSGLFGDLDLQASRDLTVASSLSYAGGNLTLEAGRNLTVNPGVTLALTSTQQNALTLSAGAPGSATPFPGGVLSIQGTISAYDVVLKQSGTGGVVISGSVQTSEGLGLEVQGAVTAIAPGTGALGTVATTDLYGYAGSISLTGANAITGLAVYGGDLRTTSGGMVIYSTAPNLVVGPNTTVSSSVISVPSQQAIVLAADAITIQGNTRPQNGPPSQTVFAPGGSVTLQPYTSGRGITVTSSATAPTGVLGLTTSQLAFISADTLQLGGSTATGGPITLGQSGETIDLTGPRGFNKLSLMAGGTVTQGGPLQVLALGGTSAGGIDLSNPANIIRQVDDLSGGAGSLVVSTAGPLTVTGTVSSSVAATLIAGGALTLANTGQVNSPGVTLIAASTGSPTPDSTAGLTIAGSIQAGRYIDLEAGTNGIGLTGTITGGALSIASQGPVVQTGGSVTASDLEGFASSVSLPSTANAISGVAQSPTGFTVMAGDFTLASPSLTIGYNSSSPSGGLSVPSNHTITLATDSLTVNANSQAASISAPDGTLAITPFTPTNTTLLTNTAPSPSGGLVITTGMLANTTEATLQLGAAVGAAGLPTGTITLGAGAETIDLGSAGFGNTHPTTFALQSAGLVTQGMDAQGNGASLAIASATPGQPGTLSGQAGTLSLLSAGNYIGTLAGFTTTAGDLAFHTGETLTVSAPVIANGGTGDVTLSSAGGTGGTAGMTLLANIRGNIVSLNSLDGYSPSTSGGINQTGGVITATTLTGAGNFATLNDANQVTNLGDFATYDAFSLTNVPSLNVTGTVTAGSVSLTANGITQDGASSIATPSFAGSSSADTVLNSRNNQISGLDSFTQSAGNFTLVTSSGLTLFPSGSGTISATSGSLNLVADTVTAANTGTITAPNGSVGFAPFTANRRIELIDTAAADPASLSISSAVTNQITALRLDVGDANTTGTINIGDPGETVDLTGHVGTLQLRTTGAVTQGDSATVGGNSTLIVNNLTGSVGSLEFSSGFNQIARIGFPDGIAGEVDGLAAGQSLNVQTSVDVAVAGVLSANATSGEARIGSGGAITVQASTVSARGVVLSASTTLTQSSGSIVAGGTLGLYSTYLTSQTGGTITTPTLTGATGSLTLNQPGNAIGAVSGATSGAVTLTDATGLAIGNGTAFGDTTLNVLSGNVSFVGDASFGILTLNVPGGTATTQTGARLAATTLTGTATSVDLAGASIGTLGDFTAPGAYSVNTLGPLTLGGTITAATIAVSTSDGGGDGVSLPSPITQTGGSLNAGTITLQSSGSFTQSAGAITASGALAISENGAFSLGGTLSGASVDLVAATRGGDAGTITQTGGTITAGTLTGSSDGGVALNGAGNLVTTLGGFTAAGPFSLTDAGSLKVSGPLVASSAALSVTGDLALNGDVTAPGSLSLTASGALAQGGGTITTASLSGNAASIALTSASNAIGAVGPFGSQAGFALVNDQDLTVAGVVSAPNGGLDLRVTNGGLTVNSTITAGIVQLQVANAVTEGSSGQLVTGQLGGSAGSMSLGGANTVGSLAQLATVDGFSLTNTSPTATGLLISGPVVAGTSFAVNNTGVINVQGALTAPTVTLASNGPADASGIHFLANGGGVPPAVVTASTSVTLATLGMIDQSGVAANTSVIATPTLSGSAGSVSLISSANAVGTLAGFTAPGGFAFTNGQALTVVGPVDAGSSPLSLTAAGNLALTGSVTGGAVSLVSSAAISEAANAGVTAASLTGSANSAALGGTNAIGTLAGFATNAGLSLSNGQGLTVTGPVTDGQSIALNVAGGLTLAGTVTAPSVALTATAGPNAPGGINQTGGTVTGTTSLTLTSSGDIGQVGGTIVAGTLSGSAGGAVSLGSTGNMVATLGGFTAAGDFTLFDGRGLTVTTPVAANTATLSTVGSLALNSGVTGGTVNLIAADLISEGPDGQVTAGTLTGSANSAALGGTNAIGTLAGFATNAGFSLSNGQGLTVTGPVTDGQSIALNVVGGLTLSGTVTAPSVALSATAVPNAPGGINQTGGVVAGTTSLTLTSSGDIGQVGGTIVAGTLSGSAGGAVSLGSAGNMVATLGGFSSANGFSLADGQSLAVSGPVTDRTGVAIATPGALSLGGTVTTGALTLTAGGAITQPGGSLVASSLTGSAGGAALTQRGNQIGTLGGFTSTADFALTDATALTVSGAVSAGPGRTLTLVDDAPSFGPGGSLSAPAGTVVLAEYTPGAGITVAGGSGLSGTPPVTASTLVIGAATGGPIDIAGAINLSTISVLDLESAGAISETGAGAIRVATLTGNGASATLGGGNQIGTLAGFTTADAFSLTNGQSLTVTALKASNASLSVAGNLSFAGASVLGGGLSLAVSQDVSETPSASVTAGSLSGTAGSLALTNPANAIGTVAGFSTNGAFSLTDGGALVVSGPLGASQIALVGSSGLTINGALSAGSVSLSTANALTEGAGGTIAATTLTGSANTASLGGANRVGILGGFTTTAGFSFVNGQALSVTGPVSDGQQVSLSTVGPLTLSGTVSAPVVTLASSNGAITQTGGTIVAGTLSGSSAGATTLGSAGNTVQRLGSFSSTGGFTLVDQAALNVAGPVTDGTSITLSTPGALSLSGSLQTGALSLSALAVTQPGGSVVASSLTGSGQSVALTQRGNQIGTLGNYTTSGDFSLTDAIPLTVTGTVTAGPNATLTLVDDSPRFAPGGSLAAPGGTVALAEYTPGQGITLAGGGGLTGSPPVTATTLVVGSASGGPVTVADAFNLANVSVLDLESAGAIREIGAGAIRVRSLVGRGASADLGGANQIDALGAFQTTNGFNLVDAQPLAVNGPVTDGQAVTLRSLGDLALSGGITAPVVTLTADGGAITQSAGAIAAGSALGLNAAGAITQTGGSMVAGTAAALGTLTLTAGGPVALAGTIETGGLAITTPGSLTQTGGNLTAAGLNGSAGGPISLGVAGTANILAIGTLSSPSAIALVDSGPLLLGGTLSSPNVAVIATRTLVFDGGVIQTNGQPASGNANLPGSFFQVLPGADGTAAINQVGLTTIVPYSGGTSTVRFGLPASGGTLSLNALNADSSSLVLSLGSGTATGTIDAASLSVFASGGSAEFGGRVNGLTGFDAAQVSQISPNVSNAYTLNGCAIGAQSCSVQSSLPATLTAAPSSVIRPDILSLDVLDLSVTRDRDDPTLLLPNISDRDY